MTGVADLLHATLTEAAARAGAEGLPARLVAGLERLAAQTHEQCVVAVVGQVKAGKSTFVNALLGGDLAVVGELETTATINYFRHGRPPDPARPVRCHWTGGVPTWEDTAFLALLQGNDEATLQRATAIHHLEYFLEHPLLQSVTLVDTPGSNAAVREHQDRVEAFLDLTTELRRHHEAETDRLAREADAVLYVTGAVARTDQRAFLEEFRRTTQGRSSALNAVGVLTKVELGEETLARRHELAAHIAGQLRGELNTVLAVGSGVQRALPTLLANDGAALHRLHAGLMEIPAHRRPRLLARDERFLEREYDDCPIDAPRRRELFAELPEDVRVWPVFATIARIVVGDGGRTVAEAEAELVEVANFAVLRDVLDRHFLARGHILRAHRILVDASDAVDEVRRGLVQERLRGGRERRRRAERMLAFIRAAGGDPATADELAALVRATVTDVDLDGSREQVCAEIGRTLEDLGENLDQLNADFDALHLLDTHRSRFDPAEYEELAALLGMRGLAAADRLRGGPPDVDGLAMRQIHWQRRAAHAPAGSVARRVYERAFARSGHLLDELTSRPAVAAH